VRKSCHEAKSANHANKGIKGIQDFCPSSPLYFSLTLASPPQRVDTKKHTALQRFELFWSKSGMIVYKVFRKNYHLKRGDLMGILVERRKDLRGKTEVESGLRWAKSVVAHLIRAKGEIFVVPYELNLENDGMLLVNKLWRKIEGIRRGIKITKIGEAEAVIEKIEDLVKKKDRSRRTGQNVIMNL
jgi:hypothetical protein